MIMIHDPQRNDETASGQGERVAKALARAGVASRRDVEKLIEAGRVALNGAVLTTPAVKVEPGDILTVDGEVVEQAEPTRLFRYHKPVDLLTTHKDPKGRPTVFDALPPGLPRLISVGRLDINSEGLLLLTNDGELARALEQPTTGLVRRYRVRARGRITQAELDKLKDGVTVEGVQYGPIDAKIDKAKEGPLGANIWITVTLAEGKNREVRRVLKSVGLLVGRLIRLSYGPFSLGTLEMGHIEEVGPRVIREQLADYIDPDNMPTGDRPQFAGKAGPPGARAVHDGSGRRSAGPADGVPKKKAVYKSGWATPKIEVKARTGKPRRAPRPGQEEAQVPVAPRMRSSRLAEDKPGGIRTFTPGQIPAVSRDRPPRAAGKPVVSRGKSFDKRDDGRSGNARGPKLSSAPPRSGPARSGPPRSGPPRSAAAGEQSSYARPPRSEGAPRSGPPRSAPPREGAVRSGPPRSGPPRSGPPREGAARSGPPRSGPPRSGSSEGAPRSGPPRSGPPGEGAARSGPPRSGPPRSGPPREGAARSGPPRSGPPRSGASEGQRSGPPREGAARPGPSRSGPPRSGPPKDGASRSGPPRSGPPRSGPPRSGPPRSGPPKSGPRGPKRD
jgi:23S rRNA pseudouridine2605 synthase